MVVSGSTRQVIKNVRHFTTRGSFGLLIYLSSVRCSIRDCSIPRLQYPSYNIPLNTLAISPSWNYTTSTTSSSSQITTDCLDT